MYVTFAPIPTHRVLVGHAILTGVRTVVAGPSRVHVLPPLVDRSQPVTPAPIQIELVGHAIDVNANAVLVGTVTRQFLP
jgi:hypothetical protein